MYAVAANNQIKTFTGQKGICGISFHKISNQTVIRYGPFDHYKRIRSRDWKIKLVQLIVQIVIILPHEAEQVNLNVKTEHL